ncbi:MAG: phosphotransferase [Burkholderiales bacterium]|nr:phosphotransferase [Burkholderiales bacterium]
MHSISTEQAERLLRQHWQLEGKVSSLASYADRNLRISTERGSFVLKIANPNWSYRDLDLENAALLHLEKSCPALTLPKLIPAHNGDYLLDFQTDSGKSCHLRVMSFVEGDVYADASQDRAVDQTILQASLGTALAQLDRGLADFKHSAMHRQVDWSISNLTTLIPEIEQLSDAQFAEIVRKHVHYFSVHEPAWKSSLPMQMIHNDANDFNVIVASDQDGYARVNAFIDFGDMCYHLRIVDLAIAIVYALQTIEQEEQVCEVITRIVGAYHQHTALGTAELEALYPIITARLCQSALMASRAYRQQPDNDYILVSQVGVRRLLTQLDQLGATQVFTHLSRLAG